MAIRTRSVDTVKVGDNVLKRVSDGHYYGVVTDIERVNRATVRLTFEDGEVLDKYGTIIVKEA